MEAGMLQGAIVLYIMPGDHSICRVTGLRCYMHNWKACYSGIGATQEVACLQALST